MIQRSTFRSAYYVLGLMLLLVLPATSQQRWTRTFGGSGSDGGYSVQQTSDGGYIVAGVTNSFGAGGYDVYLIKTNSQGDSLWTRTYGGANNDGGYCVQVQQTSDGGYIIAGHTYSFGPGTPNYPNAYLIKSNASGNLQWQRTYGWDNYDEGNSVQQTTDGGYIVAGTSRSPGSINLDIYLIKTDAYGDTLWTRVLIPSPNFDMDVALSVKQTSDGGYILTGYAAPGSIGSDAFLLRSDANGNWGWGWLYGGTNDDWGYSVQQTSDGGYIVGGFTRSFGGGSYDVYIIKADTSGNPSWTKTYGGTSHDISYSVQQTSDGGYILAGETTSFGNGDQVYLIKTNANGDTLWTRTYGGASDEMGYAVQQTSDGGYIIAGQTGSLQNPDVLLIKTDANGRSGVETPIGPLDISGVRSYLKATPNPFTSFATVPGHEGESFVFYDISGRLVGTYRGDRIGWNVPPGVYFLRALEKESKPVRIVKVR